MTDKDLIKKIKSLKGISPDKEWMNSARNELITEIGLNKEADFMGIGFFQWLKHPQAIALATCLVLIFFCGPWLSLKASQSSLPGDLLYSVKKISEDAQIIITSDDEKIELQAEFANRRLEELNKISENSFSQEEKTEKTKQLINDFKSNLAQIKENVSNAPKERVVSVARKTKEIEKDLSRTKEDISEEIKQELAGAEKAIDDVKNQILTVLTGEGENNENTASSTDEEIIIFLKDRAETTTPEIIE